MSNSEVITNRSEIVFLYDVKDTNPNGDPDENKPRIDNATGRCLVTDVRLKRTVRDFWKEYKGKSIFVMKLEREEDGIIYRETVTAADRISKGEEFKVLLKSPKIGSGDIHGLTRKIMETFLDIRLFGCTIPAITKNPDGKGKTIVRIGPVQFKLGHSLHQVDYQQGEIRGTSIFASKTGLEQGTFRADYVLPYALIGFYGIVNENNAKHTLATNADVNDLLDGLWNGTKSLCSRSKADQMPRLLLRVAYQEKNFHIGRLDEGIRLEIDPANVRDEKAIRSVADYQLTVEPLLEKLEQYQAAIARIDLIVDADLRFTCGDLIKNVQSRVGAEKVRVLNPMHITEG